MQRQSCLKLQINMRHKVGEETREGGNDTVEERRKKEKQRRCDDSALRTNLKF